MATTGTTIAKLAPCHFPSPQSEKSLSACKQAKPFVEFLFLSLRFTVRVFWNTVLLLSFANKQEQIIIFEANIELNLARPYSSLVFSTWICNSSPSIPDRLPNQFYSIDVVETKAATTLLRNLNFVTSISIKRVFAGFFLKRNLFKNTSCCGWKWNSVRHTLWEDF